MNNLYTTYLLVNDLCKHFGAFQALKNISIEINEGEMIVIPKGKQHRPFAKQEAKIMLIEPRGVVNTGNIESEITAPSDRWICCLLYTSPSPRDA